MVIIFVGATMELSLAWSIADTLNGLMAIPNLIALVGRLVLWSGKPNGTFLKK